MFIPSTTELGETPSWTYKIGMVFPYFAGEEGASRTAQLGGTDQLYWTRSPDSSFADCVYRVSQQGSFNSGSANFIGIAVRPVLNMSSEIPVSVTPDSQGYYEILVEEAAQHIITVTVNPTGAGEVTGQGTYDEGDSATVEAISGTGYTFLNWTENGTEVSTDASYTFTVEADRSLTANFHLKEYFIDVTVTQGGSVSGAGTGPGLKSLHQPLKKLLPWIQTGRRGIYTLLMITPMLPEIQVVWE